MSKLLKRMMTMLLCVALLLSVMPGSAFAAEETEAAQTVTQASTGVSGLRDDVEYVSLPITIRDFAADGMLFEFNQINQSSKTCAPWKTYEFDTGSLESSYSWSTNDHLGFRVRTYAEHGNALPYSYDWWYCVICESDGSIKKILPAGTDSKTEYATYMTSGCHSVWLWIADGSTDACLAQYQLYKEFETLLNAQTQHRYHLNYDADGTLTVGVEVKELNGRWYIVGDNNAFTLQRTDDSDYVNNLSDSDSIPGTTLISNTTSGKTPPEPVTVTLNSGAPQYVYGANLRTDLVAATLDADKKPIYTQATVDYVADLLQTLLDYDEVPYTITLAGQTYYTGYYILGQKLYDSNNNYVGKNDNAATKDLADVFRACIGGGLGNYAQAKARFDTGALSTPKDVDTYYEAAYYLLHSLWRDNATEGHTGNDGYGWNTWNYTKIHLIQTTNDNGEKCYVFNSGYDNTKYDPMSVVNGEYTGSGAIYNTQVETVTPAQHPASDGTYTGGTVYSNGVILPNARFDPLGKSGTNQSFGYGMDADTYGKLTGVYAARGEIFYPETNYHHTLEGHAKFIYHKDANQYFTFTGDDDVYLYINGKRVLDLGGAHSIAQVEINLNDVAELCGLTDGMIYDFDFFYMERHGTAANFGIETNIQIVDPSMVTAKNGYQNGVSTGYNGYVNPYMPVVYEFDLENDGEAAIHNLTFSDPSIGVSLTKDTIDLNELTNMENLSVTLYGADGAVKSSVAAGSLTEDALKQYLADGLLVGEKIVIHGFSYKISENEWECRFTDHNSNGIFDEGDTKLSNWYFFNIVYTTAVAVGDNNSVKELSGTANWVVQQQTDNGSLSITKQLGEDASHTLMGEAFTVQVLLDGKQLPIGTEYTVGDETRTVLDAGQIVVGVEETAVIRGIAYGTEFQVHELIAEENRDTYRATYEATNATVSDTGVTGIITEDTEAEVTVINHTAPGHLVETNKFVTAGATANQFTLTLESFVKGQLTDVATTTAADFVLVLDQSASMYAPAGDANGYDNSKLIGALDSSVNVTDLSIEKAQHAGYYVAQSNSGREARDADGNETTYYDWFVVQYIEGKWYYVRKDKTAMPATLDTANATYSYDNVIGETLVRDKVIEGFNYYRSGYGALYDAVTGFVDDLKATGADHRVAVVGFASPCYDAMEYFNGSGVYVNGEYYLYDAEYLIDDNGYYTYQFKDKSKTKIYLTDAQVAALNKKAAATAYDEALVSVKTNFASIEASLNAITTNYWHTCPAAGLDMANQIFAQTPANGRNRTVLLFTDGEPTVRLGANYMNSADWTQQEDGLYVANTYWTVAEGKDSAIEQAYITKHTYGANIHTIGTAGAGADTLFLNAVSSDYPNATYYPTTFVADDGTLTSFADDDATRNPTEEEIRAGMGDSIADTMFSHVTSEKVSLDDIFEEILQTTTTLELGADAVLKEVLTDYFDLENGTVADISVYTAPYKGDGTFGEKTKLETAKVTLSSSDGSDRLDTVEVTGYDYAAEFVADEARTVDGKEYYGSKLIVEVKIKTRDGFWGGNNVPTNEDTTAIYEKSGELVDKFPEPQVNVPLSLTLTSEDAVVYYGSNVLPGGLLTELTAGGMNVVINEDGTLAPQAEWMDDFATLTWTGTVSPNAALSTTQSGAYTYSAKLEPNTDGSSNTSTYPSNMAGQQVPMSGLTVQDTSTVEILVPVIPFRDSTIYQGDALPDTDYFNRVNLRDGDIKWVLMDDINTTKTATHGTAPVLTFDYEPHTTNGTYVEATAVDVTVSAQYGSAAAMDFTGVSYFDWLVCTNDTLHDEGSIALHQGSTASQNEFWIHISDKAPNGDVTTDKFVAATEDPNEFLLTLEAYAEGKVEQLTFTKPADIVLVLDHSGSMRTPAGATEVLKSGTPYTGGGEIPRSQISVEKAKHRGYYVAQSAQVSTEGNPTYTWFVMEYVENYPVSDTVTAPRWVGYSVPSTESIVDTTTGGYTEHTQTLTWVPGSVDGRLVFYKSQYAVLYDALLDFVGDLQGSGVEHNVAIVGFAGSEGAGTRLYVGSEGNGNSGVKYYKKHLYHENTTQARRNELYQLAMKNVQSDSEYAELLNNIELIETNHSFTCPTAGLQLANEVFAANAVNLAERDRILVLFTDGIPNRMMGEDRDVTVDDAKQAQIYDEIVRKAYETKNAYGSQIYTICTTTLTGSRDFLDYASSNYPNASSCTAAGTKVSNQYFHETDGLNALNEAFTTISQSTTSTTVTLDETAVLKEVLTDYFVLNPDDEVDVTVYTAPYNGDGTFGEKTELDAATVTLSSSDGSDRLDTIAVTGFDYAEEYVSDMPRTVNGENYYGSKLIVEVRVRTRDGFWGGNNVPTNEETTGIYSEGTMVENFPEPEVNVPIDVTVAAKDKTIYYSGEVTASDLIDKVTVNGVDVIIEENGSLAPAEDWMNDYADLSWTSNSTRPGDPADNLNPKDYIFQVQAEPKYDGTENRQEEPGNIAGNIDGGTVEDTPSAETTKTAQDAGHVYILVPELTFKDSTTDFGTPAEGYDYDTNNYVDEIVWVDMENGLQPGETIPDTEMTIPALDAEAVEPELERGYTPDSEGDNSLQEGAFVTDTKVNVTVSMGGTDITDIVKFDWQDDCAFGDHTDAMDISKHNGNEASNEFWVHVALNIVPDTVVIDYGLDVVIDVLRNDPKTETITPALTGIGAKDATEFGTADVAYEDGFGTLKIEQDPESQNVGVRYVLNTEKGMQINREEVFAYQATYIIKGQEKNLSAQVTVIPATSIYYEDSFVAFTVWNADATLNTDADKQWTDDGNGLDRDQNQDRPGVAGTTVNNTPASVDADKIYGYDDAYIDMATYSLGSSKKVTANKDLFAEAQFTFSGTGFDVISMTSNTTGTILVDVYAADDFAMNQYAAKCVKSFMVDTYYGYKYVLCDVTYEWDVTPEHPAGHWVRIAATEAEAGAEENEAEFPASAKDGDKVTGVEYAWIVDTEADDTLYQVPVMKVDGLAYDCYTVVITVYYRPGLDHNKADESFDFYLDAIRIYDPANDGATSETVKNAYVADNEGWPEYFELRNLLISKNDFNSLEDGQGNGIIFIDNTLDADKNATYSIADYTNYGPNNELYLAPGQSVAFQLAIPDNVAGIHLAMKSVGGTAYVKYYDAGSTTADNAPVKEIATATDLYYDITDLNNKTVVITNAGESGDAILSITNIKVTYKTEHTDSIENNFFVTTNEGVEGAIFSLARRSAPIPEEPETNKPEAETPNSGTTDNGTAEDAKPAPDKSDEAGTQNKPEAEDQKQPEVEENTPATVPSEPEQTPVQPNDPAEDLLETPAEDKKPSAPDKGKTDPEKDLLPLVLSLAGVTALIVIAIVILVIKTYKSGKKVKS